MSTIVIDVLYVKMIERTIGRKLDELDIECIYFGEPIFVQKKNGVYMSFIVPLYRFPHDLIPSSIAELPQETQFEGYFDYIKKNMGS